MKDLLSNQNITPRQRLTPLKRTVKGLKHVHARVLILASITGFVATLTVLSMVFLIPVSGNAETPREKLPEAFTGSGYIEPARDHDIIHIVVEGESLSEIAYLYNVDQDLLAVYNKIADPTRIFPGEKLQIPSHAKEKILRETPATPQPVHNVANKASGGHSVLKIRADRQFDGNAVTAHFSIDQPTDKSFTAYQWDLGNGKQAFRPNTYWSYEAPGTYAVKLHVRDKNGNTLNSNVLYIDVPHPASFQDGKQHFITLGSQQESFRVVGIIDGVAGFDSVEDAPISKVGEDGKFNIYQANKSGYFALNIDNGTDHSTLYLFVSPIKSVHADRSDINWYRTQFNTGTLSNCGPSTVAMAYAWARGDYLPVSTVRQAVGWKGDGSTSFEELNKVLKTDGVETVYTPTRSAKDFFQIIDRQNIAIALINAGGLRTERGLDHNLFGRYYSYVGGHYIVIKGYTEDHKWLITYDPIPSDWSSNSFRQGDGISMIGRNRYYAVEDILSNLRRSEVLEISR